MSVGLFGLLHSLIIVPKMLSYRVRFMEMFQSRLRLPRAALIGSLEMQTHAAVSAEMPLDRYSCKTISFPAFLQAVHPLSIITLDVLS